MFSSRFSKSVFSNSARSFLIEFALSSKSTASFINSSAARVLRSSTRLCSSASRLFCIIVLFSISSFCAFSNSLNTRRPYWVSLAILEMSIVNTLETLASPRLVSCAIVINGVEIDSHIKIYNRRISKTVS